MNVFRRTMNRDEILAQLRERILNFATLKVSRDAAEDLTQEVFIVLHEKYPEVTTLQELLPLSFQVLRYKILDYQRKSFRRGEQNQESVEDLPLCSPDDNPGVELEKKERLERLQAALNQLPDRCRELFRLKLEGKPFKEIQAQLGVSSIITVYTWDFRCRKQLLELMGGSWE